jgi:uncharacterized protein
LLFTIHNFPKNEHDCLNIKYKNENKVQQDTQTERDNPFSVLAKLKKTGD